MRRHRITTAFRLAGILLCLAFTSQVMLVDAEHFGLFECEALHAMGDPDSGNSKDIPVEGCHVACSHWPALAADVLAGVPSPSQTRIIFILRDEVAPDGPVQAIDHPPQLS